MHPKILKGIFPGGSQVSDINPELSEAELHVAAVKSLKKVKRQIQKEYTF